MNWRTFKRVPGRKRGLIAAVAVMAVAGLWLAVVASSGATASAASARPSNVPAEATGLGQLTGLLPRSKLTLPSAIEVNLSKEYVRLPIYPGVAYAGTKHAEKVWYILEDASDKGAADDLGVNYAPKLANIGVGCPACLETVHLHNPSPEQNHFGPAVIQLRRARRTSLPNAIAVPGPTASR